MQSTIHTFFVLIIFSLFCINTNAQEYKIQVAAFVNQVPFTHFAFAGINDVHMEEDQNNIYRYYIRKVFHSVEIAKKAQSIARKRGFKSAQIVNLITQKESCGYPCPYDTHGRTYSSSSSEKLQMATLFFGFDRSSLSVEATKELDKLYQLMIENKSLNATIQGHTDSMGPATYNLNLSKRRARASRNYLVAKGISSKRIKTKVFGESTPLSKNQEIGGKDNPLGRKYNRRVVIALYNNSGEIVEGF